jgi:hypothetical protein
MPDLALCDLLPRHQPVALHHLSILTHLLPWELLELVRRRHLPMPMYVWGNPTWAFADLVQHLGSTTAAELAKRCKVVPVFNARLWSDTFERLEDLPPKRNQYRQIRYRAITRNRIVHMSDREQPAILQHQRPGDICQATLLLGYNASRPTAANKPCASFWFTHIRSFTGEAHSVLAQAAHEEDPPPRNHLNRQQVADLLGITVDILATRVSRGLFPAPCMRVNRLPYWHRDALVAWRAAAAAANTEQTQQATS